MIKRNVKFYVLLTFPPKVLVFSILNLRILNVFLNTYRYMRVVLSTYAYVEVDFRTLGWNGNWFFDKKITLAVLKKREIRKWKYMQINFSTMHLIFCKDL